MKNDAASAAWPAPAKLNLFLHVLGRRADGYHELQTVFQFLDYSDSLAFDVHPESAVRRVEGPPWIAPEEDIVVRAARCLKRLAGTKQGADIRVHKRLPPGAGCGGGSSDAATTLVALNQLWGLELTSHELESLGLELGADIPVFIGGRAAWGEGVGERLQPVDLPEPWYAVIIPPLTISTREMFEAPELTRNSARITITDFVSGKGRNDFEPVACRRYPEVGRALAWLSRYAPARMTGTGASVFAAFDSESAARRVLRDKEPDVAGFVARGCNRSPLLDRLEREVGAARMRTGLRERNDGA